MKTNTQKKISRNLLNELIKKTRVIKSFNILKFIIAFVLMTTVNQITYSQTNITPDVCSQWESFGKSGEKTLLSLRSCQETDNNTAYFEIKNDSNYDVKLTYVLHFNNGQTIKGDASIELDDKVRISSKECIDTVGKGIASWEFINIKFNNKP